MENIKHFLHPRKETVDMTEGSVIRHLISFALPLVIGSFFQQLYNMVDTWVVGRFVSNEAFSAVGAAGPICSTLAGFFSGLASGAGAVISQYYGAKQEDKVRDTVHTSLVMTAFLAVLFTVIGLGMTPAMMSLMKIPPDVLPEAKSYLLIYFSGISGLLIYNMGAGILRAVGDSLRPLYFLLASAAINIAGDLLFVCAFDFGVAGVAYATILAQAISAVLVMISLARTRTCVRLQWRYLRMNWRILSQILSVGIPAAIQLSITSFSNVFVFSYINQLGTDFMSGWTAYSKIDQIIYLPMKSLALAGTTFVAQNLGKGDVNRAKKGVKISLFLAWGSTAIMLIPLMIFAPYLVQFFNNKPSVVEYGALLLRIISPFYLFSCVYQVLAGSLRGSGNSRAPMVILLGSFVAFRQAYLFVASRICNEVVPIAMSFPAGWILCCVLMTVYFLRCGFTKHSLIISSTENSEKTDC